MARIESSSSQRVELLKKMFSEKSIDLKAGHMAVQAVLGIMLRVAHEVQIVRSVAVVMKEARAEIGKGEATSLQRRLN